MTLEQFALLSGIVGALGVIASLVYLAVEIRRQSRLNRLSAAKACTFTRWTARSTS